MAQLSVKTLVELFILSLFMSIFMPLSVGYIAGIEYATSYYPNGTAVAFSTLAPAIVITLFSQVLPILLPIIVVVGFSMYIYNMYS